MYLLKNDNNLNIDYSTFYKKVLKSKVRRSSLALYFSIPNNFSDLVSPFINKNNIYFNGLKGEVVNNKFKNIKCIIMSYIKNMV